MSKSENCVTAQDGDQKAFQPGLLTGIGNFWLQAYRSFITNQNTLTTFVNRHAEDCPEFIDKVCRPSELPIYKNHASLCNCSTNSVQFNQNSAFRDLISAIGEGICNLVPNIEDYTQYFSQVYQNGKEDLERCSAYVRDPQNENERMGLVGAGAITGFIISCCNKGKLRKIVFPLAGATMVSFFVYPDEFEYYSHQCCTHLDRSWKILVNFINGPKNAEKRGTSVEMKSDTYAISGHKCSNSAECICRKVR